MYGAGDVAVDEHDVLTAVVDLEGDKPAQAPSITTSSPRRDCFRLSWPRARGFFDAMREARRALRMSVSVVPAEDG